MVINESVMNQLPRPALADLTTLPMRSGAELAEFGPVLVVAPHPDDETLGCGGLIALLSGLGCPVRVLIVSDGTGSHPRSRRYPAPALQALRAQESLTALRLLDVPPAAIRFLNFKDTAVPGKGEVEFEEAVTLCRAEIADFRPGLIACPWRRDPHCDHRASWQIVQAAVSRASEPVRIIEYPIWVWQLAEAGDAPLTNEVRAWRLDISAVLGQKQAAIASYHSQITDLIDDDPLGFRLSPETLAYFKQPFEYYLESL